MRASKLIDLRDCRLPEYERIHRDMERIQLRASALGARWIFTIFGKADKLKPIWSRRWEYPWAILAADLRPGLVVLDAGCGASPLLPWLAGNWKSLSLHGIDKGAEEESATTRKFKLLKSIGYVPTEGFHPNMDGRIRFRQESITQMSFDDHFFHRIFCISVMEHISIEARPQAMREMARVLKADGRLVMTMDLPSDDRHAAHRVVQRAGCAR